jgi:hypothetical protein
MIAWAPTSDDRTGPEKAPRADAAGLLYRLTVAFPSWAGALLALYAIFQYGLSTLKIRPR